MRERGWGGGGRGLGGEIVGTRPSHGVIALVMLNDVIPNLVSFCSKYRERAGKGGGEGGGIVGSRVIKQYK